MRISEQWLRDWVDPAVDSAELAQQLTMAGLEVDTVEPAAADFSNVVVGKVIALSQHPEADRLRIASVDVGQTEPLQIVCGAPNVSVNMCAPTAQVGAKLPDLKIKASKLRGVESQGMLCSAKELGLGENADGLMVLPPDSTPGQDVNELLQTQDQVIEVDLTPNRGDCLSIAGVSREVSVINRCTLTPVNIEAVSAEVDATFPVILTDAVDCSRYVGRVIRGVDPKASTPIWIVERLRRAGVRSLGPLVDVTNYVMLELGQPMHAFDLNKLTDSIDVRRARQGEKLTLLNGQEVTLEDDVLLITDSTGPIALAGIMGGGETEVDVDTTQDVFLESAFFNPTSVAGRARRYGLHTDASHRYERGVDPTLQARAVERATRLLIDIAGGQPGPTIDTISDQHPREPAPISLRASRIKLLLGIDIAVEDVSDILQRLGMTVSENTTGWQVTPPSFRFDITMEHDLIEEIGRIHGYNQLPIGRPATHLQIAQVPEAEVTLGRLRTTLVQRGFQEAITYSFIDEKLQQRLDPEHEAIPLSNPISTEMAVMRTNLWPGLLQALSYNQKRQQTRVRLFECGLNFQGGFNHLKQELYVGGVVSGDPLPEQWGSSGTNIDFFDIKSDVEALLNLTGSHLGFNFQAAVHPTLHPGQTARIRRGDTHVGWLGALHPRLTRELELEGPVFLFELLLDSIRQAQIPQFVELSKYPASRRDLAIVVDESVTAQQLETSIRDLGGELLRSVSIFDVYRGKSIPENQKSLTFGLILQDFSRNLTDQTVDTLITAIIAGLQQRHNAKLRE